jgi:hypothetical protein
VEGLLKSVHLANLRVTRHESAHESATAHTGERYGALNKGTKFVAEEKISDHETFNSNFIICPGYFI